MQIEEETDTIVIDAASRRNLEITDPIRADSAGPTLFSVLDGCRTSMGSRTLKKWLNNPLRSREKALSRQAAISAFFEDEALRETVLDLLKTLPDLERITTRTAMKSVRPKELASLRDALPVLDKLAARLSYLEAFSALTPDLRLDTALFQKLDAAILEEPATLLRDGDVIKSEYHPELMDLRRLRDHTGNFLIDLEERERQATGIPTLRVEYNRVQGFYIEVSKAQSANVPARYTRRQTLKNTERYITEELKAFEDKAISARERSAALEKALYDHLVSELAVYVDGLMKAAHAVAALDVFAALADHARRFHWAAPVLSERPIVKIGKGRHPVVETVIETYVPADCVMGDGRRCLIITGPNMGGKSTYMRSVALITLLAWMGSFVPAESAEIGPIDRIHTRIGASDDLARGRSTFMVEMTEAAAILHQATDRSLVLMDEIGRGTSTFDGLSLASAICHELVQPIRAFTLFATHYFEVTQLAGLLKEAVNVPRERRAGPRQDRLPPRNQRGAREPKLRDRRREARGRARTRRAARQELHEGVGAPRLDEFGRHARPLHVGAPRRRGPQARGTYGPPEGPDRRRGVDPRGRRRQSDAARSARAPLRPASARARSLDSPIRNLRL